MAVYQQQQQASMELVSSLKSTLIERWWSGLENIEIRNPASLTTSKHFLQSAFNWKQIDLSRDSFQQHLHFEFLKGHVFVVLIMIHQVFLWLKEWEWRHIIGSYRWMLPSWLNADFDFWTSRPTMHNINSNYKSIKFSLLIFQPWPFIMVEEEEDKIIKMAV